MNEFKLALENFISSEFSLSSSEKNLEISKLNLMNSLPIKELDLFVRFGITYCFSEASTHDENSCFVYIHPFLPNGMPSGSVLYLGIMTWEEIRAGLKEAKS